MIIYVSRLTTDIDLILYCRSVRAKGAVEMWLSNVEAHMFETVKR